MRALAFAISLMFVSTVAAETPDLQAIVDTHVVSGYATLARDTEALSETADRVCAPDNPALRSAYARAFDAWIGVSHLRFGPSEQAERAFALAFWPDPRGSTPKALSALIRAKDPSVSDPSAFGTVSIAARGFYALEFLLFDPQFLSADTSDYHCALVRAIATDIATTSEAILAGWQGGYGARMAVPGNETYRNETEAARQFFTSLATGLEFTSQARLGRPLGTYDRPRPNRAEARRSGRSLRHVILSLEATRALAALISGENAELDQAFGTALQRAVRLDDPVFAGVAEPSGRFQVEVLQQSIDRVRAILAEEVGPSLGISAGFNALDGD